MASGHPANGMSLRWWDRIDARPTLALASRILLGAPDEAPEFAPDRIPTDDLPAELLAYLLVHGDEIAGRDGAGSSSWTLQHRQQGRGVVFRRPRFDGGDLQTGREGRAPAWATIWTLVRVVAAPATGAWAAPAPKGGCWLAPSGVDWIRCASSQLLSSGPAAWLSATPMAGGAAAKPG